MDRTQCLSKNIFNKWESTFNAGSFLVAAATISGTPLISWLKTPISKEGVFLASLLNGSAVLLADKIAEKGGIKETYYRTALTLFFVAGSTFAVPYVTLTLFAKTVTEISFGAVCQIALSNLFIKAVTFASNKLYESRLSSMPSISEEIKKLSPEEFTRISMVLKNSDKKEWDKLDLPSQIGWNNAWIAANAPTLLFTNLDPKVAISMNDLILIKEINETDTSEGLIQFLNVKQQMIYSPILNKEQVTTVKLNMRKDVVKAPETLVKLNARTPITWNINSAAGGKIFTSNKFWDAVEEINNENIIKTIKHAINLTTYAIKYQLLNNQKPFTLTRITPPITVTVNNFAQTGKGCEIIIKMNFITKNLAPMEVSASITFENKEALDQLQGKVKFI